MAEPMSPCPFWPPGSRVGTCQPDGRLRWNKTQGNCLDVWGLLVLFFLFFFFKATSLGLKILNLCGENLWRFRDGGDWPRCL